MPATACHKPPARRPVLPVIRNTPGTPGDRNLFIKRVIVNGAAIPASQLKPDAASHGITDDTGTSLYQNGSLWVMAPLVPGCT